MARRRAADRGAGGGERIPPSRARTHLIPAAAALAAAAGVAAYAVADASGSRAPVAALGSSAVLLLALGLVGRASTAVAGALVLLGAAYALSAWTHGRAVGGAAAIVAAGVLIAAELAYWSLEHGGVVTEGEVVWRRLAAVFGVAAAALVLASGLLVAVELRPGGGAALEAVGVAAAVGVLAVVVLLAHREEHR